MKRYEKYMKPIVAFVFGVALIAVYKTFDNISHVLSFFGDIFSALTPFIIGFIIAYILNLPGKKLESLYKKAKPGLISDRAKGLSIITVYLLFFAIVFFVMRAVIPRLYANVVDLYNNLLPATQDALLKIEGFAKSAGIDFFDVNDETVKEAIQKILNSINLREFGKYAQGAINFTSGLLDAFIALIVSVYMLLDRENIIRSTKRIVNVLLPQDKARTIENYAERINVIFSKYIYSCVLDAIIVAILSTTILSIIGVKYAIILGTLIGVCNLIPYFGSIVSNCFTVIVTIFTGGWVKALWAAISLFILGQLDGNIIGPKIMGNKLDARPLEIIFAVTLGGGLFGIWGMVLSVPVVMAVKMICSEWFISIEKKKSANTPRE